MKTNEIEYKLRKNMTNAICLMGSNISSMEYLLKKKYVSKKEMRKLLKQQMEYLESIQNSKNNILQKINE